MISGAATKIELSRITQEQTTLLSRSSCLQNIFAVLLGLTWLNRHAKSQLICFVFKKAK